MRLKDEKLDRELFFNPELVSAEAYMDGRLTFEDGSTVYDFLMLFSVNRRGLASHPVQQALRRSCARSSAGTSPTPLGRSQQRPEPLRPPPEFYRCGSIRA